jgi:hypothetical protein
MMTLARSFFLQTKVSRVGKLQEILQSSSHQPAAAAISNAHTENVFNRKSLFNCCGAKNKFVKFSAQIA